MSQVGKVFMAGGDGAGIADGLEAALCGSGSRVSGKRWPERCSSAVVRWRDNP